MAAKLQVSSSMSIARKKRKTNTLIARDGNHCWYCLREFNADLPSTLDHVIPLSQGGTNENENLVLACFTCNQIKGDDPSEYPRGCLEYLYGNQMVYLS